MWKLDLWLITELQNEGIPKSWEKTTYWETKSQGWEEMSDIRQYWWCWILGQVRVEDIGEHTKHVSELQKGHL